jgi:hypothetical protein
LENIMNGDVVGTLEQEIEKAIARVVRRLAKERKLTAPSSDQTYHWMAKAAVAVLEAVADQ